MNDRLRREQEKRTTGNAIRSRLIVLTLTAVFSSHTGSAVTVDLSAGSNPGPWTFDPGTNTFNVTATGAAMDGVMSGDGDLLLQSKDVNNAVIKVDLNAQATYTGITRLKSVDARFGVVLGVDNAFPVTSVMRFETTDNGTGRPVWLDLNGHSQEFAGIDEVGPTYNAIVNGNTSQAGALIVTNDDDITYSSFLGEAGAQGNIANQVGGAGENFSFTKGGSGVLTFTKNHTHTGATTINDGKLRGVAGGGCAGSEVILNAASATFGVSIGDNTQSWTCAALTAAAAGTLEFDFDGATPGTTVSPLVVTGAADFTAATPLVDVIVSSGLLPGTYPLVAWNSVSGTAPATAELTVAGLFAGTAAALNVSGNTLELVITGDPAPCSRPFIWVRDSERAEILDKIANNSWATSVFNGMVARVAGDLASHQSDRDAFLRQLPVDWSLSPAEFKTIPAYSESSVRGPTEGKFNNALDCAVLYYLTGDTAYAACAADILHNAVTCLLPVSPSTSSNNGGWIFQNDFLKEARVTGTQLPIVYDFLCSFLHTNQVYDVQSGGMVSFDFADAQEVFRTLYGLARDHGQKNNNWSALMSTCMLNSLLALDDETERDAALQVYLVTGSSRQASLDDDAGYFTDPRDVWPESLQYASAIPNIRTSHMVLLERVDPGLDLFGSYPDLILSLPRISQLRYPNREKISFGDGRRTAASQPFFSYELVYQHALARGRTDLTSHFGSLINGGVDAGTYDRSALKGYSSLGQHNEPLQLLWLAPDIPEPAMPLEMPRADAVPVLGIALQRNLSPDDDPDHGLMCFVGGAGHVHSHASGMSMELYGLGEVMGAKSGTSSYSSAIHQDYYRVFASNNTVIVNGASRGDGGWADIAINTVQTVAMEPQPFASPVSPDYSFTCSSFADNKGNLAEATQQRTMAIVRTSPTSGFYLDVFRSNSTVTNRTATTLEGNVTDQYHDYIYRNIGETTVDLRAGGTTLPLFSQANRFQNDIGDSYDQPGWRYFSNTEVSYPTSQPVTAQFVATVSGVPRYMDMHMPAVAGREYARVDCPPIVDAPDPYDDRPAPALVIRQIGEAWDQAFAAVYEPHFGSSGTVQNVTSLVRDGVVVGVKVESLPAGNSAVHYIFANPGDGETYEDASIGLSFTGRFGIVADLGGGMVNLYLGEGSAIAYNGSSLTTVSGSSSEAEVRFAPGQDPLVTANEPVNVVANPVIDATWLPVAGSPGLDWDHTANWNPAVVPNGPGSKASMDVDLTGDQTVNLNVPITLGRLVIGDTTGGQTMTLQKGGNGALIFEGADDEPALLMRAAGGTGNVNLGGDVDVTLNSDLTVRLADGTLDPTMLIAGDIGGAGKGLTKESDPLILRLAGTNGFTGAMVVNGGTLQLGNAGATGSLPGISGLTVNGGVLAVNRNNTFTQLVDLNGRSISGAGGFSQVGTGTTVLSVPNTFGGPTTVSDGTLQLGASEVIPDGTGSGNVAVDGALDLNGFSETINGLSGSGIVDNTAAGSSSTLTVGGNDQGGTFDGILRNSGASATLSLVKTGTGTLVLGGANTLGGTVAIDGGRLAFTNTSPLENVSAITMAGGTTLRPDVLHAVINAPLTVGAGGTTVTINAPSTKGGANGTAPVPVTIGGAISGDGNVTFRGIENSNAYGRITLNAAGSYAGSTLITTDGSNRNLFVRLGTDNALPATTVLTLDGGNGAGSSPGRYCELNLNGHHQTLAGLTSVTGRSLRVQRIVNNSATTATLTVNNSDDFTYAAQLGRVSGYGSASYNNLGLAKAGSGRLTLSGALRYTGDTTVNQGILGLGEANPNNDGSKVTIAASGATIELSHAGTDHVGVLLVGGTRQPGGIYGHTDSGADNGGMGVGALDAYFEPGPGTLTVAPGGYADWAAVNAPTTGNDSSADEDRDGVANGLEYVLGGTIGTNDRGKLPTISTNNGDLVFTFERDQGSIDGSTRVDIEVGTTLVTWPDSYSVPDGAVANNPGVTVLKDVPAAGLDTVLLTVPMDASSKFARLKVTEE